MEKNAREICELIGGELVGDGTIVVTRLRGIQDAEPGDISFVADPRYATIAAQSRASILLVGRNWNAPLSQALIRCANPSAAFQRLAELTAPPPVKFEPGIHPTAVVAAGVQLGRDVSIQPYAVIEAGAVIGDQTVIGAHVYIGHQVRIGSQCMIWPRVVIRDRCLIGNRVILHPGVVLGADGFGYSSGPEGHKKIPQLGIVEIEDDVEIGANSTIDRARFDRTLVKQGAKIDNLVQIGHNCSIGRHAILCSQTGISGSCTIGDRAILAGQAGIADHVNIGAGAIILAQAGIPSDVPAGAKMFGSVAHPYHIALRIESLKGRLPELFARIKQLETKLGVTAPDKGDVKSNG